MCVGGARGLTSGCDGLTFLILSFTRYEDHALPRTTVPTYGLEQPDAPDVLVRIPPSALLDLHRLATMREVARCGSYSAAADSLRFTPSAVSQQMSGLARDLGFAVFERTPRGMRLTPSAEVLLEHVDGVFARLNHAQADLDALAVGLSGRLRIGSFPTATVVFLAETLGLFQDRFPAVRTSLTDGEPYESIARLKERELDLAAVFDFDHWALSADSDGRLVCDDSEIDCTHLFDDPFSVILPHDHQLAASESVRIDELAGERILAGPPGCSPWASDLRELCRHAGVQAEIDTSYRTVDFAALQAIVATGRGVTLVPELALLPRHAGVVTRPLIDGPVRHVQIATLAGVASSPAVTAMVELLEDAAVRRRAEPRRLGTVTS